MLNIRDRSGSVVPSSNFPRERRQRKKAGFGEGHSGYMWWERSVSSECAAEVWGRRRELGRLLQLSLCYPQVAPVLKERMVKKGTMMIGYQPHGTRANFFRMVVANPILAQADIDFLLGELELLGQDL